MHPWRDIDKNPNSPRSRAAVRQALRWRLRGRTFDLDAFLQTFVSGRVLLDIGCVDHDATLSLSPSWRHRKLAAWARSALGIDILEQEVALLQQAGFNVAVVDATSDHDLTSRFDRITAIEVVEHVDNPVALLRFCRRHLSDGGEILITTPNPYYLRFVVASARSPFVGNVDHISWISPPMALELGRRADLDLQEYWLVQNHTHVLHRLRDAAGLALSELFTTRFGFVYKVAKAQPDVQFYEETVRWGSRTSSDR